MLNPIVYAIPVFFGLMGAEWLLAHRRGVRAFRLGDTVSSVGLGAISQVTGLFSKAINLGIYVFVYENLRLTTLPQDAWWVWLVALLLYDFLYYWHHRLGHRVGVLWAAHVVHHQSEDFNLGTALRQTSSGFLLGWVFYLPMAIAGFPPLVFVVVALIDLLYQYWIHTEQIGRLGWFDRVFASPSNHRVHHGVNDRYVDRNYGGILILWDRLFGSFQDELPQEPVVYGTRKPLRSHDPVWANLEVYAALARMSWHTRRWRDKLAVWWKPPGWQPEDLAQREPHPAFMAAEARKYDPPLQTPAIVYGLSTFLVLMAVGTHCIAVAESLPLRIALAYGGWLSLSLWALSRWTEARRASAAILALAMVLPIGMLLLSGQWFGRTLGDAALAATVISLAAFALGAMLAAPHRETGELSLSVPGTPA